MGLCRGNTSVSPGVSTRHEMTEKDSDKDVVKFDELLLTVVHVQEAIIELSVEKGVIDKENSRLR